MTPRFSLLSFLALSTAALAFSSCGEDSESPHPTGSVRGTITRVETGEPVAGAEVVLVSPETITPASSLTRADATGGYRIDGVLPGSYAVFVYQDTLLLFDRTAPLLEVTAGRIATHDVRMMDSALWGSRGHRVQGTVSDAVTGTPIAGAFVEGIWWANQDVETPFTGVTVPQWAVTDALGRFSIRVMVFTDERGNEIGLEPISVTREGYEAATVGGGGPHFDGLPAPLPLPPAGDSVLTAAVALRPLPPGGAGSRGAGAIGGRVTYLGQPVAGLRVAASLFSVSRPDTYPILPPRTARRVEVAVPIQGTQGLTAADGRFLLDRLDPGWYAVHPGFLDGDGYVRIDSQRLLVEDGDTTEAGEVRVAKAIRPLYPPEHAVIVERTPELVWEDRPDTTGYTFRQYILSFAVSHIEWTEIRSLQEPRWQVPDSRAFDPGAQVRWKVEVVGYPRPAGPFPETIATFEHLATFTVAR